jgi:hypothetical protein
MSIAPVEGFTPPRNEQSSSAPLANVTLRASRVPAPPKPVSAEEAAPSVSGTLPKQETTVAKNVAPPRELSEDVVELHQDPEIKDQIIIQYLDPARDVVLQVPSNQELSVERGIVRDSQQAAKLRATDRAATAAGAASAVREGEKAHGD